MSDYEAVKGKVKGKHMNWNTKKALKPLCFKASEEVWVRRFELPAS